MKKKHKKRFRLKSPIAQDLRSSKYKKRIAETKKRKKARYKEAFDKE